MSASRSDAWIQTDRGGLAITSKTLRNPFCLAVRTVVSRVHDLCVCIQTHSCPFNDTMLSGTLQSNNLSGSNRETGQAHVAGSLRSSNRKGEDECRCLGSFDELDAALHQCGDRRRHPFCRSGCGWAFSSV